jgi:galactokinase
MSADKREALECHCIDRYSIEPHGNAFALYYGRCGHRHGYNLCKLSDFDIHAEQTMTDIVKALDRILETTRVPEAEPMIKEHLMALVYAVQELFGSQADMRQYYETKLLDTLHAIVKNATGLGLEGRI